MGTERSGRRMDGHVEDSGSQNAEGAGDDPLAEATQDAMADQAQRMERLRRAQAFVAGPLFPDLRDAAPEVSDDAAALEERRRELDYRIELMDSVLALLREERDAIDRVRRSGDA